MNDKFQSTPKSGYLARKLVNASRDFYITELECNYISRNGLRMKASKALGRTTVEGIEVSKTSHNSDDFVTVRSPVYCMATKGVCATCYGTDPLTRRKVTVGSPVGVIAAQALTEPTTQLTMRSKHTAGAAEVKDSVLVVKSSVSGIVHVDQKDKFKTYTIDGLTYVCDEESSNSLVTDGEEIEEGQILAVYTDENLANADITNKLNVMESYYEVRLEGDTTSIIAPDDGDVSLYIEDGVVAIRMHGKELGRVSGLPIFVADRQRVKRGTRLTFGEIDLKTYDDFSLQVQMFCDRVFEIYEEENIVPWMCHIEMICRSISEIVRSKQSGEFEYWRYSRSSPRFLMGVTDVGIHNPSFLKALSFGYTSRVITRAACSNAKSYDLPSERLMQGLYPLIDIDQEKKSVA